MTEALRVLVVDDERLNRDTMVQQLDEAGYVAAAADNAETALAMVAAQPFDVVLTDLRMPGMDGIQLVERLQEVPHRPDVLLMTAYGSVETAVATMRAGAVDYMTKPFRFPELEVRLARIAEIRATRAELARLRAAAAGFHTGELVGRSPGIRLACERARLFSEHDAPVLITGETGTGKEVVARMIHDEGSRARRPFVAVACGAIPAELAESELFGHEKGAFTGAGQRRIGCFERANGGTLLLDDVDDLPLEIQVKLLRVLQEGTLVRVGGSDSLSVDVRVIATAKVDLATAVQAGHFRDDLYYRLRGLEVSLPPLSERGDDVVLLANHFLARSSSASKSLSLEAIAMLRRHSWPGNVRELARVIEAALVLAGDEPSVGPSHLPESLASSVPRRGFQLELDGFERVDLPALVHAFEDAVIDWGMTRAGGQQTRAAELLGVPRTSLQSKLTRSRSGS